MEMTWGAFKCKACLSIVIDIHETILTVKKKKKN